ncbi:MAG: cobyric acid synthase, partial [Prevotella sp.]|nr:cobyric acid synthase [Prevotella sp.]
VAVVLLRHMSNFTDFSPLERDSRINLFYTDRPDDMEQADIIILPGTKSTLDDLYLLRRNGMAQAIINAHASGKTIIGICGGYQIMGTTVSDPDGIEGSCECMPGLGLIAMHTTMKAEKTTRQVEFTFNGARCKGYEIHQGVSTATEQVTMEENCIGTYIHGFFDNPAVVDFLIHNSQCIMHNCALAQQDNSTLNTPHSTLLGFDEFKSQQYDLLADHLRRHIDMDKLYEIMTRSND